MLFIFRKLRRSFFLPGKVRTYLAYAIGEILLIVIGIMLAVQIGEWKQERRDHTEETQILLKLKPEFEFNQRNLEKIREIYMEVSEDMEAFSAIIQPQPQDYEEGLVFKYLYSLRMNRYFTPIYGELGSILNSGRIGLISNEALGSQLNRWPRKIADIDQMMDLMKSAMSRYPQNFDNYRNRDVLHFAGRNSGKGRSDFPSDLDKVLSNPILEDMAETKGSYANLLVLNFDFLLRDQQEVLDLINAELEGRGVGAE